MKDLLIRGHLGLGDHIITNGLVRHFAHHGRWVHVMVKPPNVASVTWMFQDNPLIVPFEVDSDEHAEQILALRSTQQDREILRLGCTGAGWTTGQDFDQTFYRQAGVPFEQRWEGFHVERAPDELLRPSQTFAFIHDDPNRGFNLRSLPAEVLGVVRADSYKVPNIFQWRRILEDALEVHCIPSSFSALWDSLPEIKPQKLFLHGSARPGWDRHTYRKEWQIV